MTPSRTVPMPPRSSPTLLRERILVLDGAMGTMIQGDRPDEAGYRGERFADWPSDLDRQQRPADAHPARHDPRDPPSSTSRPAPTSSRPTPSTPTRISLADYGLEDAAYELNVEPRPRWPARPPTRSRRADRPRYVAGALGPTTRTASISPDVNDPGARNVTFDQLVAAYLEAGPRPGRRRRRPAADRDDLRHPQRQGRDLRRRDALRGARPPLAGDHLRHDHRRVRPHPLRPGHRGVLELRPPRPAAGGRPQLRARRRGHAPLRRRAVAGSPTRFVSVLPQRRPAQRLR